MILTLTEMGAVQEDWVQGGQMSSTLFWTREG